MNVRMEMEHGTRLSTLEVNAELAGVDLSGSKLEGYARTVIRSKNMLQIIKNALNTVRLDPDHGELMYQILYLTSSRRGSWPTVKQSLQSSSE